MDRNEIAKKRKEEVVKLLQNMNIKKDAAGGFSKDDVYTCMQILQVSFFEANIAQMEKEYGQDIQVLQQQLNTEKRTVQQRVAAAKKEAEQEAEIKNREIQQRLQKYEANNDVYINMMMEAKEQQ